MSRNPPPADPVAGERDPRAPLALRVQRGVAAIDAIAGLGDEQTMLAAIVSAASALVGGAEASIDAGDGAASTSGSAGWTADLRGPDGQTLGRLAVRPAAGDPPLDAEDEVVLAAFARGASLMMAHNRMRRELSSRRVESARLVRLNLGLLQQARPGRMLQAAVDLARTAIDAGYAALLLLGDDGAVRSFHYSGVTPAEAGRIGAPPDAAGLLGVLARERRPIRLADVRSHPAFTGLPSAHMELTSLLAIPVNGLRTWLGVLMCANRRGIAEFSADDERVGTAIAGAVAIALDAQPPEGDYLAQQLATASQRRRDDERAQWEFISAMSHELRSLMSGVLMSADLLADPGFGTLGTDRGVLLATRIGTVSRHAVGLLDNLLDIARIRSHRLEVTLQPVDVGQMLRDVRDVVESQAAGAGVLLDIADGSTAPRILADPLRARQVLVNLLTNAIKFTPRDGHVWLDLESGDHDLLVSVSDTGPGIAPEDQERIFEAHERVGAIPAPGAGLGLAISRAIVELHGGRLDVASWPGHGSRFTAAFRLAREPFLGAEFEAAIQEDGALIGPEGRGASVLVVDDDSAIVDSTGSVLTAAGYRTVCVGTCVGAMTAMAEHRPDLVLLDVQLPDGDGLGLVPRMRELAGPRGVVILAFSADRIGDSEERARGLCDGFILKPLRPRELLRRLREATPAAG